MIFITLTILLFAAYAFLILLYRNGWQKYDEETPARPGMQLPRLTVLIPARNEGENIGACIRSILANDYPKDRLEIILADDFSEDDTARIAAGLLEGANGRVLSLKDYLNPEQRLNSYKKKALEIAIEAASGEWIVTTDADCTVPPHWLQELAAAMAVPGRQFIAAPVSFIPHPGAGAHWLYYFQSLDFMTMQGITAASIRHNLGNMCNGANLAFRKAAFHEVGGYKGIDHIASGDDMLLMHKIQVRYPGGIGYLRSPAAIVQTPVQPDWRSFLNQRIRWSSKADKYDDKKLTAILSIVYFFNLLFPVLLIAGFFRPVFFIVLLAALIAKTIVELIFLVPVARFYHKTKELGRFAILQPLHILYIISAGFLGKFGSYQWKGRKVR